MGETSLELWGADSAANVQKVIWFLKELDRPFVLKGMGFPSATGRERAYLRIRDVRSSPVLQDGELVLWEANAIVRYLADRYGDGSFYAREPAARADADRWMDYQLSTIRGPLHALIREELDSAKVADRARLLAEAMEPVEETLRMQKYLAGNAFSIGDIPVGITVYRWSVLDVPKPPAPAIDAWLARLSARPAFIATVRPPAGGHVGLVGA